MVANGRSPPTSTLTWPSGSMRIVMLASTRRKLSARGLRDQKARSGNADLGLRRDRDRGAGRRRAARCRAGGARCGPGRRARAGCRRPRRDSGCRDSARSPTVSHGVARSSMIGPLASRHHSAPPPTTPRRPRPPARDRGAAHHRMPAVEHEPGIERQPPTGRGAAPTDARASAIRRAARRGAERRRPPGCAGAHRAPLPIPGAPRCADCYPCPSCPIGRPLVRRLATGRCACHTVPANRFSWRLSGFAQNPARPPPPADPLPNAA